MRILLGHKRHRVWHTTQVEQGGCVCVCVCAFVCVVCVCCWGCIILNWVHSAYLGIHEQGQYLIY